MMKNSIILFLLWFVLSGCIERYYPETKSIDSILVVEGFITSGTTQITLTQSVGLDVSSYDDLVTVDHASVYVECNDGSRFEATSCSGNGIYRITTGELNVDAKYRLVVQVDHDIFQSDFLAPAINQPVNVSFTSDNTDIHVCVTTKAGDDQTGYYFWSFKEDWEIQSYVEGSWVIFKTDKKYIYEEMNQFIAAGWVIGAMDILRGYIRVRNDLHSPNNKYYCWGKNSSKIPIIASTYNLINNDIHERKIWSFPRTDDRTSVLYRIQVKQTGIHKEAYDYYNNVSKNIEGTGGIFAHIPSEITGNIKCISNPDIPVIGYVDVSTTCTEDIQYLDNTFWYPTLRNGKCNDCKSFIGPPKNFLMLELGHGWVLYEINGSNVIQEYCVDCTKIGGTKDKPEDWPTENQ